MAEKGALLQDKAIANLKRLSNRGRKEVEDFISYLRVKEEVEATKEILKDKNLAQSIIRGEEDAKAGRMKSWKSVKEDV